jgi:hypothetical protein
LRCDKIVPLSGGLGVRSIRRHSIVIAALALSACASDATFMRQNGAMPDSQQLEADASACRSFWPLVGGFFVGAAYGAAEGALVGAASAVQILAPSSEPGPVA